MALGYQLLIHVMFVHAETDSDLHKLLISLLLHEAECDCVICSLLLLFVTVKRSAALVSSNVTCEIMIHHTSRYFLLHRYRPGWTPTTFTKVVLFTNTKIYELKKEAISSSRLRLTLCLTITSVVTLRRSQPH